MAVSIENIEKQFNVLRQNLLDLSMRNQLLNFRPRKRSIKVVDEITTEIYDILVLNEQIMEFLPLPEKDEDDEKENNGEQQSKLNLSKEESDELWALPSPNIEVDERHKDLFLQTRLNSKDLQKRLFNIYQQASSVLNEQGYNVLYLGLGFLEWKESPDSIDHRTAPLLLIPVELNRKGVKKSFQLYWNGEDIINNISLQSKLKEQGVDIPDFEMPDEKEGIYNYFKQVEISISEMENWNIKHEIYLGFFSFAKFVMYQDLDRSNWPGEFSFEDSPIIKALFDTDELDNIDVGFFEDDVDRLLPSKNLFTVLDADSSQLAVIEDVKIGKNLVVEGPPGTGKSQTIVNIIAELLAMEKSVLFVSEKMAALEVVKNRLDSIGLGDFCLELHSRKSNKKKVLNELQRILNLNNNYFNFSSDKYEKIDIIKSDLNDYNELIHKPVGKIGLSAFELFGIKEESILHFENKGIDMPLVNIVNSRDYSPEEWHESIAKLDNISEILRSIIPFKQMPWKFANPGVILPSDQETIKSVIRSLLSILKEIDTDFDYLSELSGISTPLNKKEFDEYLEYAIKISKSEIIEEELLKSEQWDQENLASKEIINQLREFQDISSKFNKELLDIDIRRKINAFNSVNKNLFSVPSDVFFSYKDKTLGDIDNLIKLLLDLNKSMGFLIDSSGIVKPQNLSELDESINIAFKVADSPIIEPHVLNNPEWDYFNGNSIRIIQELKKYQNYGQLLSTFKIGILDIDIRRKINAFNSVNKNLFSVPSDVFFSYKDKTLGDIDNLIKLLLDLNKSMGFLIDSSGIVKPQNLSELDESINIAFKVADSPIIEPHVLNNPEWDYFNGNSIRIIQELKKYQNYGQLLSTFKIGILDKDLKSLKDSFSNLSEKRLKFISGDYKKNKKLLMSFYVVDAPVDDLELISDLESLILCQDLRNKIRESDVVARHLFGSKWISEDSNPEELESLSKWLVEFRSLLNQGKITEKAIEIISTHQNHQNIQNLTFRIRETFNSIEKKLFSLSEILIFSIDEPFNFSEMETQINNLKKILGEYFEIKNELMSFYVVDAPVDDLELISDLESLILCQDLRNKIRESDVVARHLFGSKWISEDSNPEELESLSKWLVEFRSLLNQGKITEKAIEIISTHQNHENINDLILKISECSNSIETILMSLSEILIFSIDEPFNFSEMETQINNLKKILGEYFEIKNELMSFYVVDAPVDDLELISDLESLILCQDLRNKIRESDVVARHLFGSKWISEDSNPEELESLSKWLVEFRSLLNQGKITEKAIEIISTHQNPELVPKQIDQIKITYEKFLNNLKTLNNYLNFDCENLFKLGISKTNFSDLESIMNDFDNELYKLSLWSQYLSLRNENLPLVKSILKLAEMDLIDPDDLVLSLKGNFAENILKELFLETSDLRNFVGDLHESKIRKFSILDEELLKINRKRIEHKLAQNRPDSYFSSPNSELGVLLGQFNRKRRHMPIRKLLSAAGGVIKQIKPCFMMSPLSIAQFIDPQSISNQKFDVVIFDEASQVKPEDALGALLRGKQLIVMGDTKQLPPTSFFDTMVDADEEDEELNTLVDMESILHFCKTSFPTKMLKWHYRSRHESLIAVSNQEFYDNQLFIYPSPCHNSKKLGLQFLHLENAIYDRGNSSINLEEAKAVVKAAFEHYEEYGDTKSLGIGTFNTKQQNAILEILELELKRNPKLEQHFAIGKGESFFVKNLETIQGDERDVILISVGFGFDSNHKLNQNFGPLNKDGGERRLNVLATRAREKCVVFSNFLHSDLNIGPNSPFGLRSLKVFLEYAKTKNLVSVVSPGEDTDSPFEDSVYKFLTENGFEVHKQVGCAGFRIDLAIVDPKNRGRYLIGIECDGATYHSSKVARDRDRLRQQILEGLGWKIHRIWSTDWFRNRKGSILNLFNAIEDSKLNKTILPTKIENEEPETLEGPVDGINGTFNVHEKLESKDFVKEYVMCDSLSIVNDCDLHEKSIEELAHTIKTIVEIEGPVHFEEVVRRIRTHWGLKKAGKRIKDHLSASVHYTASMSEIIVFNDFLYMKDAEIVVRKRTGDPPAKIELICNEEIVEAVKMILKRQFATPQDELTIAVAKTFGFKSTRKNTSEKINGVIDKLLSEKKLIRMSNGSINLYN